MRRGIVLAILIGFAIGSALARFVRIDGGWKL
jgi:hypothetical protein